MKGKIILGSIVLVLFSFLASNSEAFMHRVWFNAWTQAEHNQPNKVIAFIEIGDDERLHPPDFVQEIRITAPPIPPATVGKVFYLNLVKDWLPWDKAYYRAFTSNDFTPGVPIPGGTWSVRVTADDTIRIAEADSVAASYLPIPQVTYPTAGATNVQATPKFTWNAVAGATYYRILLFNVSHSEPVYFYSFRTKYTDFLYYEIPPGDLKPNCDYRMQIEARAGSQDMDMRSRSAWINFKTGAW
jgi:hypothetical protein